MTRDLLVFFIENLEKYPELHGDIDTSPLLNMSIGVFMGALINLLDEIKIKTIGEVKLIENIELAKSSLLKAIQDLPFIKKVEFF
jgi:hypothetical protein